MANGLSAAIVFILGLVILVRGRASLASSLFALVCIAGSGWLFSSALTAAALVPAVARFWWKVGHIPAALAPAATLHFAAEFVGRRHRLRGVIVLAWFLSALMAMITAATPLFGTGVHRYRWGFYPATSLLNTIPLTLYAVVFAGALYLFWDVYHTTTDVTVRDRARMMLMAFLVASISFVDALPAKGINVFPLSWLGICGFVSIAAHAVWRFHLLDVTPEFAASQILETIKSAVVVVDMNGKVRVVNRAASTLLSCAREDLIGAPIRTFIDPAETMSTGQLLISGGVLEHPMVWHAATGANIDVLVSSSFVRDSEGRPVAVVYVASDVTERRRNEEALRESEHRYRNLFDANPLPMWVYDFETLYFVAVNEAALRHYGYSRDEFLGMRILDIRPPEDVAEVLRAMAEIEGYQRPRLFRHRKKDGTVIEVEITSLDLYTGGRRARLVIAQDVTERRRAETSLRESEERYRELFENANDMVYVHDLQGRITSVNRAGERMTGFAREDLLGRRIEILIAPEWRDRIQTAISRHVRDGIDSMYFEAELLSREGRRIAVEVSTRVILHDNRPVGVQAIARDVTERKANEERFRLLFERNLAGVFRSTVDGVVLDCNEACARIFGYQRREDFIAGPAQSLYFDPEDRVRVVQMLRQQKSISNLELRMRRADGSPIWVLENVSLLENHDRGPDLMEGTIIDITERKIALEQVEYQAYHDVLTGLPNRLLFRDRIAVALAHARRTGRAAAVMFLDLDQFKLVNDTLGHTIGDRLLQAVARRIVDCVRAEDTVARMGGDEFTILLGDVGDRRGAALVAQKVLDSIGTSLVVETHELYATTSIGIAMFPDDGSDAETLLRSADRAMYRAKESGRNNFQFAMESDEEADRLSIERHLRFALDREEFVLHYQPIVDARSSRIVGVEALVRWNHPQEGLVPPDRFIPLAEASQLIHSLGEWVLRTACAQMKAWHDSGHRGLRVAVNISARQLQHRDFPRLVEKVLADSGLGPQYLDLEITETTAMQNPEQSLLIMQRLKAMGIRISIDDFGTGYSSLAYLKRFPIDTVKIDRHFVRDIVIDIHDAAIVSAVISMSKALDLRVVAEGIENQEQLDFLQREQCGEMQGFLFGRPVPADEVVLSTSDVRS